ncbi:MAG TPA: hypothetical protein DEV81_21520 [Cyanobacteria bacterium UBA11049]|nr:hypothetical protein [Cyanobacteria bacterium UBA11049]
MTVTTILAILLVAYNPIDSLKNFIAINENKICIKSNNNKTTMNYSKNSVYSSSFTTAQSHSSYQQQTTSISVNSNALNSPHILSIKTTDNTQMNGKVTVDGVIIKKLQGSEISFNLSPELAKGTKRVEISGTYKPASSSVKIEFSGPSTNVTQQISGNGRLNQTLVITVR